MSNTCFRDLVKRSRARREASLRPSTRRNRQNHWDQFRLFLRPLSSRPRTAGPTRLLAFLEFKLSAGLASATVLNYLSSLRSMFKSKGWRGGYLYHQSVQEWVAGLERWNDDDFKAQPYISSDQLMEVIEVATQSGHVLLFRALLSFAFYTMMRASNLTVADAEDFDHTLCLTRSDIIFTDDGFEVGIRWSKTLQKKSQATWLAVPATNDMTCPRAHLKAYLDATQDVDDTQPLFVWADATPVTQKEVREILKSLHQFTSIDPAARTHGLTMCPTLYGIVVRVRLALIREADARRAHLER